MTYYHRKLENRTPVNGERRQKGVVLEERALDLFELFFGHGDEQQGEAGGDTKAASGA